MTTDMPLDHALLEAALLSRTDGPAAVVTITLANAAMGWRRLAADAYSKAGRLQAELDRVRGEKGATPTTSHDLKGCPSAVDDLGPAWR